MVRCGSPNGSPRASGGYPPTRRRTLCRPARRARRVQPVVGPSLLLPSRCSLLVLGLGGGLGCVIRSRDAHGWRYWSSAAERVPERWPGGASAGRASPPLRGTERWAAAERAPGGTPLSCAPRGKAGARAVASGFACADRSPVADPAPRGYSPENAAGAAGARPKDEQFARFMPHLNLILTTTHDQPERSVREGP